MPPLELPSVEWSQLGPELILIGGALVMLVVGTFDRSGSVGRGYSLFTVVIALSALVLSAALWVDVTGPTGQPRLGLAEAVVIDGFSVFFDLVICAAVVLAALISSPFLGREGLERPSYFVLMLLSASGGMFMAKANDLILVFLGLEVLSIALYVLAGYHQRRAESQEAAMKYFVLGAFSSAFFLYGVALTYGATGTTNLGEIAAFLRSQVLTGAVLLGGLGLMLVGLGFKVAAVPFHMWTPDVYQGSPTPVTGFMAAVAKAAGFAALLRIFASAFGILRLDWQPLVWLLAVLTLVVGSVLAVVQTDVKRMLAYSSIAHAGYVLVGLQAATDDGLAGALYYLLAYTFMILGSFAVVTLVGGEGDARHSLDDYRGLARERPGLAMALAVLLLAQLGAPFTTGFLAKFSVIAAAVDQGSYNLAVIAMLAAVVAAFFYLRLVVVMYSAEEEPAAGEELAVEAPPATAAAGTATAGTATAGTATAVAAPASTTTPVQIPAAIAVALFLAVAFTVVAGLVPEPVLDLARRATMLRL